MYAPFFIIGFVWSVFFRVPGITTTAAVFCTLVWFTFIETGRAPLDAFFLYPLFVVMGGLVGAFLYLVFDFSRFVVRHLGPSWYGIWSALGAAVVLSAVAIAWGAWSHAPWNFIVIAAAMGVVVVISLVALPYDDMPYMSTRRTLVHFWTGVSLLFTVLLNGALQWAVPAVSSLVWALATVGAHLAALVFLNGTLFLWFTSITEPPRDPYHDRDEDADDRGSSPPEELITDDRILEETTRRSLHRRGGGDDSAPTTPRGSRRHRVNEVD